MKLQSLIIGIVIGAIITFSLLKIFNSNSNTKISQLKEAAVIKSDSAGATEWPWDDSLDAVHAAPQNHHVIFENDKIRILEVILMPHEYEELHAHRFPSVMFGADNSDTSAFDIVYYVYDYDSLHHKYFAKDSIVQHNKGGKSNEPNTGNFMKPEGPHRIKNLSNVKIDVFRVEFKPDNKK
jgi:hypothetical protein